jgi:hypothetical protein
MTLDEALRSQIDAQLGLHDEIQISFDAANNIRREGRRIIRRRRISVAALVAVVGMFLLVAGLTVPSLSHTGSPAVGGTNPPTYATMFDSPLLMSIVTVQHPASTSGDCPSGQTPSFDLTTCYKSQGPELKIKQVGIAELRLPPRSPGSTDELSAAQRAIVKQRMLLNDAAIDVRINDADQTGRIATFLTEAAGKQVVFSVAGTAISSRPAAKLILPRVHGDGSWTFEITGAPDILQQAWGSLTGYTWSPSAATLPATNAQPLQVAVAYLEALSQHDVATALALSRQAQSPAGESAFRRYVESIDEIVNLQPTGFPLPTFSGVQGVVTTSIHIDYDQKRHLTNYQPDGQTDTSWPASFSSVNGPHNIDATFTLTRRALGQPWRITHISTIDFSGG